MLILVKICKYFDFGRYLWKSRLWTKIMKISISKISILVNIYENLDFGQNWWKSPFWSKFSGNLDVGKHAREISILVNIFGKIDLRQNFPQILVLVQISEKFRFLSKFVNMSILIKTFSKNNDFGRHFRNSQFWWKLSKILKFGQICLKFSILVKIV